VAALGAEVALAVRFEPRVCTGSGDGAGAGAGNDWTPSPDGVLP
jgi:hypothetical protein